MSKEKKYLLPGIPILFIVGALFHFIYELSNENFLVGLISPINESIWEHTKMIVLPMTLYWCIYYKLNKSELNKNTWFFALLISLITSILLVPILYYFYTESFGFESVVIDISILFISLLIGHLLGIHVYENKNSSMNYLISIFLIILIIGVYIIFTINPPNIPLFIPHTY